MNETKNSILFGFICLACCISMAISNLTHLPPERLEVYDDPIIYYQGRTESIVQQPVLELNQNQSQGVATPTVAVVDESISFPKPKMYEAKISGIKQAEGSNSDKESRVGPFKEGSIKKSLMQLANQYFDQLPKTLVKRMEESGWKIYITDKNVAKKYCPELHLKSVMGVTMPLKSRVYIENRESAIKGALMHEAGHVLDILLDFPSDYKEFKKCFEAERKSFKKMGGNKYATKARVEFFAEVFSDAILRPEWCKKAAPKSYKFVIKQIESLE